MHRKHVFNYLLISLLSLLLLIPCFGYGNTVKAEDEVTVEEVNEVIEETGETAVEEEVVLSEEETTVEQQEEPEELEQIEEIEEVELIPEEEIFEQSQAIVVDGEEDENVLNTNYTMGVNDSKTVTLKGYGETHKIKITLTKSGYFNITAMFHEITDDQVKIGMYVYDDINNNYLNYSYYDQREMYKNVETYCRAGVYTIELKRDTGIWNNRGDSRKITITTEFTASAESFVESNTKNDDAQSRAHLISLNKEYKGLLASFDAWDYYKFELKDAFTVPTFTISWFGNSSNYLYLKIFDKSGNELEELRTYQSNSWSPRELPKGTYYVALGNDLGWGSRGNGKYSFKITKTYQGWMQNKYWYEKGVRQGVKGDPKNIWAKGSERGREIYDPVSDGWYWLDAIYQGAKATNKEVWMPYIYQDEDKWNAKQIDAIASGSGTMASQVKRAIKNKEGKWVRYDENGKMYKEWYSVGNYDNTYPTQRGNTYYYDKTTGLMAKGKTQIGTQWFNFDSVTGAKIN